MKRFKYTVRPEEVWNTGAVEQWLEDEAARGWRLYHCGSRLARFERAEPAACRVRLQPHEPEPSERWRERIAAYEAMGWVYAEELQKQYEVFYCDDPAAPELESDPAVQKWAWEKSLKRSWRNAWLLLLGYGAIAAWALVMMALAGNPVENLLRGGGLLLLYITFPLCLTAVDSVRRLGIVRRTRRLLDAGIAPPHTGDWKRMRRLDGANFACVWLLALILAVNNLVPAFTGHSWENLDDADAPQPCVAAETLDPALVPSLRKYGWVRKEGAFLLPEQYEFTEVYPDQRRLESTWERLLPSPFAGPLYREKLAAFREKFPGASLTELEGADLDQAAVLKSGEVSLLAARQGNIVFTLRINFPADLEDCLDELSAALAEGR